MITSKGHPNIHIFFDNPKSQTLYGNKMWLHVVCKNCLTIFKREISTIISNQLQITYWHAPKEAKFQTSAGNKQAPVGKRKKKNPSSTSTSLGDCLLRKNYKMLTNIQPLKYQIAKICTKSKCFCTLLIVHTYNFVSTSEETQV